jgi:ribosomal protein S18 acetylase RimI-like enzyme
MIAKAVGQTSTIEHIRPFITYRDLEALAALIEVAFAPELEATGSNIVYDMRQMALSGPVLWMAGSVMTPFTGFVWYEEQQLVGNISLSQEREPAGTWTISNVAVLPTFRRRGIASQLLDVGIEHIRRQHGQHILLQVRADNESAISLYRRRGFSTFDTLHELSLPGYAWPTLVGKLNRPLRLVRARDWRALYHLVVTSTPSATLRRRPVHPQMYRRGLLWQMQQLFQTALNDQQMYELVGGKEGEVVAYGRVTTRLLRGPYELALYVLPGERGMWEMSLLQDMLNLLDGMTRHTVMTYVSTSHPEALQALHDMGFRTLRVLDQMALDL